MTENHKARIDNIIRNGYDFKFGDYISQGFEILQKELGLFILFTLVFFAISFASQLIPVIGPLANSFIIQPALVVGFFIAAHHLNKGERIEFGVFFKGFDFLGNLALVVLIMSLIMVVCFLPFIIPAIGSGIVQFFMDSINDPIGMQGELPPFTGAMVGGFIISFILMVYFVISYSWAPMFVVFYKMSFWDAMESSRKLISKQWLFVFLFFFVVMIITMMGMLLLCVGLLATIPAAYCMQYAAFADVTKLNQEPDADDMIDQHLIVD